MHHKRAEKQVQDISVRKRVGTSRKPVMYCLHETSPPVLKHERQALYIDGTNSVSLVFVVGDEAK